MRRRSTPSSPAARIVLKAAAKADDPADRIVEVKEGEEERDEFKDDGKMEQEIVDDGPAPVGNGGTNEFYTWTQLLGTVKKRI